jgi:hypothetical protein
MPKRKRITLSLREFERATGISRRNSKALREGDEKGTSPLSKKGTSPLSTEKMLASFLPKRQTFTTIKP